MSEVRVRIAPSPTGDPHVGLAYMTLFNYVFAKKNHGKLILRIEDTDQLRYNPQSEGRIMAGLRWLGLKWDEGPDVGGAYGPYRQSERAATYQKYAQELLEKGKAYRCFCSAATLDEIRAQQRQAGKNIGYDGRCRSLTAAEIEKHLQGKHSHVLRLIVPRPGTIQFTDELRGVLSFDADQIDDQVLLKSDGFATYHLANVVDDHLMKITHVIRAEEWIASTPKHVLLYEAFGWQPPQFIHMPLLRNKDKSKISKRKNPISLDYYRIKGILPEAMLNFLALMGWSLNDHEEIFSLAQMQESFTWSRMHLGGPVFDLDKLTWINSQYVQKLPCEEFIRMLRDEVFSPEKLTQLYPLVRNRLESFEQFIEKNAFFFTGSLALQSADFMPPLEPAVVAQGLQSLLEKLDEIYDWRAEILQKVMDTERATLGWKPKDYYMTVRKIVSGRQDSPPLAEMLEVLGRELVRRRIRDACELIARAN